MAKNLDILLAEDEYLSLLGIKVDLEELGHNVIAEATDGEEAVELAVSKEPDLIVMDINMPSLDGIEAIARINEKLIIPSIIVTGYDDENLIQRASEQGVFNYLVKPIDIKDLKAAIELTLARFEEFNQIRSELKDAKKALESRKYIERAKGILMDKKSLKEAEAMRRLQQMSRNNNLKLVKLAKKIIEADELFDELKNDY
ncbi:MAG: ANTAR domain-containing response regulator [bacterium]